MHRPRLLPALMAVSAAALGTAACDVESDADADLDPQVQDTTLMADTLADQQAQEMYEASIEGMEGSDATGTATVSVEDDEVVVTVAVTGLEPDTRVPQHIHLNAACDNAGGILLNLDSDLSAGGEGEPSGDAYPETDEDGRLEYEATRSLEDIRTAMGEAGGEDLDLGNRVVNLHGPDMQAIACGALDRSQAGGM